MALQESGLLTLRGRDEEGADHQQTYGGRGGEVVREVTTKIAPFSLDEELVVSEIPIGKFAIEELSEKYLVIRRAPDIRR